MHAAVHRLPAELKRSTEAGGENYETPCERGKLLPRDRVEMLLMKTFSGDRRWRAMAWKMVSGRRCCGVGLVCGREPGHGNEATVAAAPPKVG
jgi:acetyl-CoA carboxylase carboxyltransferase component